MSSKPSIRCEGVGKAFQLYTHQNDQLKQVLFGLWKKFYTDKWVLHDVNFTVDKGEHVGIIGRNGAGKTTLLQILCGITLPTKGDVRGEGPDGADSRAGLRLRRVADGPRERPYRRAPSWVFRARRSTPRIDGIAAFADIGQFFEQPMRTYSRAWWRASLSRSAPMPTPTS